MFSKLCVCGRSQNYPLCDNSHIGQLWSCKNEDVSAIYGFCSSPRYQNIVQKLASHFQGLVLRPGGEKIHVENLIIVIEKR